MERWVRMRMGEWAEVGLRGVAVERGTITSVRAVYGGTVVCCIAWKGPAHSKTCWFHLRHRVPGAFVIGVEYMTAEFGGPA